MKLLRGIILILATAILIFSLPAQARRVKDDSITQWLKIRPVQNEEEKWQLWEFALRCGAPIILGKHINEVENFVLACDSRTQELLGGFYYLFKLPRRGNCGTIHWHIFVHPEHRFEGIGRSLFQNFVERLKNYGLESFYFYTLKDALPFMESMGAEQVGFHILKGYRMYYKIPQDDNED